MNNKEKLNIWFEAIGFKQNYVFKKNRYGWVCTLYLPYIDKNVLGTGKSKDDSMLDVIDRASHELFENDNALIPIEKILGNSRHTFKKRNEGGTEVRTLIIK